MALLALTALALPAGAAVQAPSGPAQQNGAITADPPSSRASGAARLVAEAESEWRGTDSEPPIGALVLASLAAMALVAGRRLGR